MKNILISVSLLFVTIASFGQVTPTQNYIHHRVYKNPIQLGSELSAVEDDILQSVHYMDGKGRLLQKTDINAGGNREDIISYQEYDALGRQNRNYLPYSKSNNNGAYVNSVIVDGANYYDSERYDYVTNPYTEFAFDESHISKPARIALPGNAYHMDFAHTKKVVRITNSASEVRRYVAGYTNTNNPELLYYGYFDAGMLNKVVYKNENWTPADGNNNTTHIFTDHTGAKVLMRNFNEGNALDTYYVYDDHGNIIYMIPPIVKHSDLFASEPIIHQLYDDLSQVFNMGSNDALQFVSKVGNGAITITILNDILTVNFNATFPNATAVLENQTPYIGSYLDIPPGILGRLDCSPGLPDLLEVHIGQGSSLYFKKRYPYSHITGFNETFTLNLNPNPEIDPAMVINPDILDRLCYQYKYDYKGRMAEKKLPAAAWEYIIYDAHNRPILTQNGWQRDQYNNTWAFTKYDVMGRVACKGILYDHNYPTFPQADMQFWADQQTTFENKTTTPVDYNGNNFYYTNSWDYSIGINEAYYYDDYNFDTDGLVLPASTFYDTPIITNTKGLLTGIKSRPDYDISLSTTILGYERMDRLIFKSAKNPLLATTDIAESKIDFTGKILETRARHTKAGVITNLITFDYYMYDHADRLIRHTRKTGSSATELITFNKYDDLGTFVEKKNGRGLTPTVLTGIARTGRDYRKTAGASWTNASMLSSSALINNGSMSFRTLSGNYELRIGLSYSPDATTYTQINYAIAFTATPMSGGNTAIIYETGSHKMTFPYRPDEEYTIERIDSTIYYKKNGVTFYQSSIAATSQNLRIDAHIYTQNSGVTDLQVNNYAYNNAIALETTKYKYNIQGSLTKINDPQAATGTGLFNMEIKYEAPEEGISYYNGNISEIDWKTANDPANVKRRYIFSYDHLHRYTKASSKKYSSMNVLASGTYDEYINYDDAGNILNVARSGINDTSQTWIDDLSYTYNGNQLKAVSDATGNAEGFKDGASLATEYTYDIDGNMISDANKGITYISYNDLNLPVYIYLTPVNGQSRMITFVYDSQGNKLSKSVYNAGNTTTTQYAGDYVYVQVNSGPFVMQYVAHPEGYVSNVNGVYKYVYQHRDHLGNVRLSYTDADMNGVATIADIIEENNYYPFGLKHKGYNYNYVSLSGSNPYNKIAFQGQEMIEDLGLNWNSFLWRNYDPALGRFFNIDPLAEKYSFMSPYQFSSNQPIHAPELEGLESSEHQDDVDGGQFPEVEVFGDQRSWFERTFDDIFGSKVDEVNQYEDYAEFTAEYEHNEYEYEEDLKEAARTALDFTIVGSALDVYESVNDGNWIAVAAFSAILVADLATLGGASLVKGTIKTAVKQGYKALAKKAVKEAAESAAKTGANLSTNGVKLAKQLASEAQMAEKGLIIIGPGRLREATRLAKEYGGNATDWVKKSSSSFTKNGTTFETHWYENISTGVRTEFKTKFP